MRDLYNVTAAARGHWVIYGTPKRIADTLEEWFVSGLADGFMVLPAYFPGAFDDFVDLVVPELQRRGLFRTEYRADVARPSRPRPVRAVAHGVARAIPRILDGRQFFAVDSVVDGNHEIAPLAAIYLAKIYRPLTIHFDECPGIQTGRILHGGHLHFQHAAL